MTELIETPLLVLHIIIAAFLVLVVLIQPGKSGGMGALTGAAATQVFGGRGAGNVLTKTTWVTGAIFFLTSVGLGYLSSSSDDSLAERAAAAEIESSPLETTPPVTGTPAPAVPVEPASPDE